MHLDLDALETGLDQIRQSPTDGGPVELIVRRPAEDEREVLAEAKLDPTTGLLGDTWLDRSADPERQVTLMNARVIALLARTR